MGSSSDNDVVLVTGASAGLGLALARLLALRTRYRLVLTARANSVLRFHIAGIQDSDRIMVRSLDVTDADQRQDLIAEIDDRWGGVDTLVNNAGVSYRSVFEHVSEQERLEQMDVNFRSPMELTRLVLPGMRARRHGRVISISSVGGMMAMPTMAVYSASKFALEGAMEALWYEVRPWGIHVTLVEPGFINSSSFYKVRMTRESARSARDHSEPYHLHYESMAPFIERMMRGASTTPERIARKLLRTMRRKRPPLRVPATPDAWLFSTLRRVLPRRVYHWVLYRSLPRVREWGSFDSVLELPAKRSSPPLPATIDAAVENCIAADIRPAPGAETDVRSTVTTAIPPTVSGRPTRHL